MNPNSLKNLRNIKKGQVLNPEGGRTHNQAQKALRRLTIDTYREVIELALSSNLTALKSLAQNPMTPAIQVGIATSLIKAINKGDYSVLELLASRIVGKIPDELNVNSKNETQLSVIDEKKVAAALKKIESDV